MSSIRDKKILYAMPIDKIIELFWEERTGGENENLMLLDSIDESLNDIQNIFKENISQSLLNHIMIYDQFLMWSINLSLKSRNFLNDNIIKGSNIHKIACSLATIPGSITSHLFSIRNLVISGHDVPAKQVLRSLSEHADLLIVMTKDLDLAVKFQDSIDVDECNKFWHQHVAKGKIKNRKNHIILGELDEYSRKNWTEYREEEDRALGAAVHPTAIGCLMSSIPSGSNPNIDIPGFFGVQSESSIRTLQYAKIIIWELSLITEFPYLIRYKEKSEELTIEFDKENALDRTIEMGRSVLSDLVINTMYRPDEENHPDLEPKFGSWPFSDE